MLTNELFNFWDCLSQTDSKLQEIISPFQKDEWSSSDYSKMLHEYKTLMVLETVLEEPFHEPQGIFILIIFCYVEDNCYFFICFV